MADNVTTLDGVTISAPMRKPLPGLPGMPAGLSRAASDAVTQATQGAKDEESRLKPLIDKEDAALAGLKPPDLPAPPDLGKPPEAPKAQESDPLRVFKQFIPVMAILGGAFIRGHATAAMDAASAAMEAAKTNDANALKQAHETFMDKMEAFNAASKAQVDQYNLIVNNKKMNWDDKLAAINAYGAAFQHEGILQAARTGQMAPIMDYVQRYSEAQRTVQEHTDRIREINARYGSSPDAANVIAQQMLANGGVLPAGVSRNAGLAKQSWDRYAELLKETGGTPEQIAHAQLERKAAITAAQSGLRAVQNKIALTEPAEQSALQELDYVERLATKLTRTGSPLVNRPLNAIQNEIMGNPDLTSFQSAVGSAVGEVAKVISGSTGAGGITDAARAEAKTLINDSMSIAQIAAAVNTAKQSMAYKIDALHQERNDILSSISGDDKAVPDAGGSGGTTFSDLPDPSQYSGKTMVNDDGKRVRSDGKNWVPVP